MKRTVATITLLLMTASMGYGAVKTVGSNATLAFDPSNFPPDMRSNYEIVQEKCVGCHTLERLVVAVTSGVAPISGQVFSSRCLVKGFGCKPRKGRQTASKQDAKAALDLTNYLLKQADKP